MEVVELEFNRILFSVRPELSIAASAEGKPLTLTGYALRWNDVSDDRGGYRVRLLPNSAKFADPVHALYSHDLSQVLGTTENGSLRLKSDEQGVKVEIDLPDTTTGRDVSTLVSKGYLRGMSFAMAQRPDGQVTTENGVRILNAAQYTVDEVTITASPSFRQTSIGVKTPDQSFAARAAHALDLERLKFAVVRL